MEVNIGIPTDSRKKVAGGLSRLLADTYTLYLKTHNYHWNVTGSMFQTLHTLFETQYTELAVAVDDIAERVRSLGHRAPGSYKEFAELTTVNEDTTAPKAKEMVARLLESHEAVARTARSVFPDAESGNDEATLDLLTQRLQVHEKTAWMLRALLEE